MNAKIETQPLADWYPLTQQFKLTLKVSGRSLRTAEAYDLAIRELLHYLLNMGLRIGPSEVTAEHLRMFLASLMDHCAPATINQRYRSLNRFFGWIVEEGERTDNPLARIPVPKVPQRNVRALSLDEVRAMLRIPDRKTFLGSRDYAMMLCLVDTGLRAGEFLSMRASRENPEVITVVGKGNKERMARLGEKSQLAVMRYQRMRQKFGVGPGEDLLWVSRWGRPLTRSGLLRVLKAAGRAAGLPGIYTHLMRHTFATLALDAEAPQEAVRVLMGHTSDTMLRRYTRTRDMERALAAHRKFSPGDML